MEMREVPYEVLLRFDVEDPGKLAGWHLLMSCWPEENGVRQGPRMNIGPLNVAQAEARGWTLEKLMTHAQLAALKTAEVEIAKREATEVELLKAAGERNDAQAKLSSMELENFDLKTRVAALSDQIAKLTASSSAA